ncbi:hypothetical protein AQUCO_05700015v1 [Aquilegia coerulea]|uniref:F-box associated beta-propeller type 3 domain-containing protein n=1 Tax=Aquilegia coerulea TaxID=218851 RepID=A0A2G5CGS6_AQUCA|nr:hypothetical protein AQUCO_05700015v1 [Aquilegia coerulea]
MAAKVSRLTPHLVTNSCFGSKKDCLSRCRFVNKDWKNLFTDPIFIELCNSRINKNEPIFLVLCQTSIGGLSELYLVNNENHDSKLTAMKFFLHAQLPKGKIQIIGSCNGLICLWCSGYFYICNPLIGEIFKLPKATIVDSLPRKEYYNNSYLGSTGFGFDASTNTYKVVHTSGFRDSHRLFQTGVEIYTLGSGTWRKINEAWFYVSRYTHQTVFVHGALHWEICFGQANFENCQIVAIDIEAETFRALKIPTLTSLGERLSLVEKANDQTIVWIMHDYGNQESWTKEYIVDRELLEPLHISLKLLQMVKNDRILFHGRNGEGYYDVTKNERMKHFHIHGLQLNYVNLDVVVHYGSLISPGRLAKS